MTEKPTYAELEQKIRTLEEQSVMEKGADVTAHNFAEKAPMASETDFRRLVEFSSDLIWEVNSNGVFTYVSPQIEDMLGYKPAEIIGRTPFDLMPSEEADQIAEVFRDLVKAGKPIVNVENVNLHKEGRFVVLETSGHQILDETGKIIGYRGVDRDITERKQAEEHLKVSEKRFREIIEDVSKISIQGYDEERRVIFWNKASEKLYGYTEKEAFGSKLEDLIIPAKMQEKIKRLHRRWVEYGEKIPSGPLDLRNKNCDEVHIYSSHVMHDTPHGKEMFCLDVDLGPIRQAEQEREKLIKKLQGALDDVKTLSGLLPICSKCKKIRDDNGYWNTLEAYIESHSEVLFSHGLCSECLDALYGNDDWYIKSKMGRSENES